MISDDFTDSSAKAKPVRFIIANTAHSSMTNGLFFFNENTSLFFFLIAAKPWYCPYDS
jgi:hypothetical protein